MEAISARDAAELLRDEPEETILLDVREHAELAIAAIPGALHIPMGEIAARLTELDPNKIIICVCHMGGRSAQVTQFLNSQGCSRAVNLNGGITAWSQDVDPGIPFY